METTLSEITTANLKANPLATYVPGYGMTMPTVQSVSKKLECGMCLVEGGTCGNIARRVVIAIPSNSADPESGTRLKTTMLCADHAAPYRSPATDVVLCDCDL